MNGGYAELDGLIVGYLNGDLDAERLAALDGRLRTDPAAARRLLWWSRQDLALRQLAPLAAPVSARVVRSRWRPRRLPSGGAVWQWAVAAGLLLGMVVWWSLAAETRPERSPTAVATTADETGPAVGRIVGQVRIRRADAILPVAAGDVLRPGDVVDGADGQAVLAYADGTVLELRRGTRLVITGGSAAKQVRLESGALLAEVAPQRQGMRLTTPQGEALVLGTRFTLAVAAEATWLEVMQGRVRLTRIADAASVEVAAGHLAVAGHGVDCAARVVSAEAVNLAFGRPVTASSTYAGVDETGLAHTPDMANDGDVATCWGSRDNHIAPDPNAWWQVDLGLPGLIGRIELVTRQDLHDQILARGNFDIQAADAADGRDAVVIARHRGTPIPQHGTWTATVRMERPYRYLRVVFLNPSYGSFAEFRAFGRIWNGMPPATP